MVVVWPSSVAPMNPVATGSTRPDRRNTFAKYARVRRLVLLKSTPACVNWSSVTRKSRASANTAGCVLLRYAAMMSADRRSPKLAVISSARDGQWRRR